MTWKSYEIRTEELTTRTYKVRAQSYRHALAIVRDRLENEETIEHDCIDIFNHGEEVKS